MYNPFSLEKRRRSMRRTSGSDEDRFQLRSVVWIARYGKEGEEQQEARSTAFSSTTAWMCWLLAHHHKCSQKCSLHERVRKRSKSLKHCKNDAKKRNFLALNTIGEHKCLREYNGAPDRMLQLLPKTITNPEKVVGSGCEKMCVFSRTSLT